MSTSGVGALETGCRDQEAHCPNYWQQSETEESLHKIKCEKDSYFTQSQHHQVTYFQHQQ